MAMPSLRSMCADGVIRPALLSLTAMRGQDGYDAVEWCAMQPWSSGKVGTIGGSYNGKTQWLTAVEEPPHLTTMIAIVSPSDPFVEFPTGDPIPIDVSWYHFTSGRSEERRVGKEVRI